MGLCEYTLVIIMYVCPLQYVVHRTQQRYGLIADLITVQVYNFGYKGMTSDNNEIRELAQKPNLKQPPKAMD